MNSTPVNLDSTILDTALHPAPPTPKTVIFGFMALNSSVESIDPTDCFLCFGCSVVSTSGITFFVL